MIGGEHDAKLTIPPKKSSGLVCGCVCWASHSTQVFIRWAEPETGHEGKLPSAARERQPERGHLLAVTNQQHVADQHRVVPGLALDRREPRELRELIGCRPHERKFTLLRKHQ